jgi:hypothetical protein
VGRWFFLGSFRVIPPPFIAYIVLKNGVKPYKKKTKISFDNSVPK